MMLVYHIQFLYPNGLFIVSLSSARKKNLQCQYLDVVNVFSITDVLWSIITTVSRWRIKNRSVVAYETQNIIISHRDFAHKLIRMDKKRFVGKGTRVPGCLLVAGLGGVRLGGPE